VDIAIVGQSFAQGYCVPDGQTFGDLLGARQRVVMNLGQSGDSALLQLAEIKEYLSRYKPRVVLWVHAENIDLADLHGAATHPIVMKYLDPTFTQNLFNRQSEIDRLLRPIAFDAQQRLDTRIVPVRSLRESATEIVKLWDVREGIGLVYGITSDDEGSWHP